MQNSSFQCNISNLFARLLQHRTIISVMLTVEIRKKPYTNRKLNTLLIFGKRYERNKNSINSSQDEVGHHSLEVLAL